MVQYSTLALYSTDALTKAEAVTMLTEMQKGKEAREAQLLATGYPAYTTAAGESTA